MNNVCIVNQNITDKFKHLDDEQYQSEYKEHCRKMSIIDSYEEEIKEVLFLSSGCVDKSTHSYQQFGLGLKPDYIDIVSLLDKVQALKAKNLRLVFNEYNCGYFGGFADQTTEHEYGLRFILEYSNKDYLNYFTSIVNKYSLEFCNKEYFLRCEGSFMDSYYTLCTKDESWKMEYLRHADILKTPLEFTLAALLPIFGWLFILYSICVAVNIYIKHWRK